MTRNWRLVQELAHHQVEALDVGLVQRRVHFVEDAEGRGARAEDGEEQRDHGHGLLAAGEQRDVARFLARRARDDLDARFQDVFAFLQQQVGLAAAEELAEGFVEVRLDGFESLLEQAAAVPVDARDDVLEAGARRVQVLELRLEEGVARLEFLLFLQGAHVHGAEARQPFLKLPHQRLGGRRGLRLGFSDFGFWIFGLRTG